ncbi:uncharacterized protein LOC144631474 [Oculina patagonica]
MATQEEQRFLDGFLTKGGITPSLELVEKDFHRSGITDKGKKVEQCTEQNDVHFHTATCWTASRPCMHLMSAAILIPESENIPIRTRRNIPAEGDDQTSLGC